MGTEDGGWRMMEDERRMEAGGHNRRAHRSKAPVANGGVPISPARSSLDPK